MPETKKCPRCAKQMVKASTGLVFLSDPPQYPMKWWCACGYEERAETVRGKSDQELLREQWESANQ